MRFLVISFLFILSACSTFENIQKSRNQNILIRTPHVEGAKCVISDSIGRSWKLKKTPGTVTIQDGHSPLRVICNKTGYITSVSTIDEQKQELLTVDGERITLGLYQKFPARKVPRLIPSAIKEASGFVLDPIGSVSTEFPSEITMWMEPKEWQSEDKMREWAFEKGAWIKDRLIAKAEEKEKDDLRKAKRREIKQAGKEKVKETATRIFVETTDPKTYSDAMRKSSKWLVNANDELVDGTVDSIDILDDGLSRTNQDAIGQLVDRSEIIIERTWDGAKDTVVYVKDGASNITAKTNANIATEAKTIHRIGQEYNEQLMEYGSKILENGKNGVMDKSKWLPNWLKYSTKSKVGKENEKAKQKNEEKLQQNQIMLNETQHTPILQDIPPWELERKMQEMEEKNN